MTKQERSDAHTWVDQRCTVCGVSQHSMGATMSGCAKEAEDDDRPFREAHDWSVTTINVVATLASTAKRIARLEAQLEEAKADRDHMIGRALEEGASVRTVAKVAGVSKSRVDQIGKGTN